jgi:hypothetical protein
LEGSSSGLIKYNAGINLDGLKKHEINVMMVSAAALNSASHEHVSAALFITQSARLHGVSELVCSYGNILTVIREVSA